MPNNTFVQGLASSLDLPSIAQQVARNIEIERERKRQLDEKKRQQDLMQSILGKLTADGENTLGEQTTYGQPQANPDNYTNTIGNLVKNINPQDRLGQYTTSTPLSDFGESTLTPQKQLTSNFEPYTPAQKTALYMMLDNQTRDDYKKAQDMFNPQPKYTNFLDENKNIAYDSTSRSWKNILTGKTVDPTQYQQEWTKYYNPESRFVQEKNKKTGEIRDTQNLNNVNYKPRERFLDTSFDKNTGKFVDAYGYQGLDGKNVVTRRSAIAPVKNKNGAPHISKGANKLLDDYYVQQQKLKADYESMVNGRGLYDNYGRPRTIKEQDTNWIGVQKERPINISDISKAVASHNAKYINLVKSSMPEGLRTWYTGLYNMEDPNTGKKMGSNPNQKTFWNSLVNSYLKGELTPADFQYGIHLFRATYSSDPVTKFGTNLPNTNEDDTGDE